MPNQPHHHTDSVWPVPRSPATRRRALVFSGLLLLVLVVLGSIKLIAVEAVKFEKRGIAKRQFQLGGILGEAFREVISAKTNDSEPELDNTQPDSAETHPTSSITIKPLVSSNTSLDPSIKSTSSLGGPSPSAPVNGAADPNDLNDSHSKNILATLTQAVKKVIEGSFQLSPVTPDSSGDDALSEVLLGGNTELTSDTSVLPRPSSLSLSPTASIGILGGLSGIGLSSGVIHARADMQPPQAVSSDDSYSFLSCLSNIVAEISDIDPAAAVRLIDAVLGALRVNSSAIASIVPQVAGQASVNTSDLLPFIIPAVASAMGEPVRPYPSTGALGLVETLNKVLGQGSAVINDLTKTMGSITDPALQSVLNQLASIISAAANYLSVPLCAVIQVSDNVTYEVIMPCVSAHAGPPVSAGQPTSMPVQSVTGAAPNIPGSMSIVTLVSPSAYLPLGSETPAPIPAPISEDPNKTDGQGPSPGITPTPTQKEGEGGTPTNPNVSSGVAPVPSSCPVVEHPPCPTCPSCDQCPPQNCPTLGPNDPSVRPPLDPSVGPCPGRGFKCAECLNGWFCPPQETPAQVVPCGLGWPCYHCPSGWFCESEKVPTSTPSPTAITSVADKTSTENQATPTSIPDPDPDSLPANWTYLGCFQDAISRTLLGAKPIDYLQGDMSRAACVDHCSSRGYCFAGTEYGKECWCGSYIRDDAIRLPESQCGMPCQGAKGSCGGSWAIAVYMGPGENKPPKKPYGAMSQLLASFKADTEGLRLQGRRSIGSAQSHIQPAIHGR